MARESVTDNLNDRLSIHPTEHKRMFCDSMRCKQVALRSVILPDRSPLSDPLERDILSLSCCSDVKFSIFTNWWVNQP